MVFRYPCDDVELTDGDSEFGGKVWTGDRNVGINSI